jgi:hypothetical protein
VASKPSQVRVIERVLGAGDSGTCGQPQAIGATREHGCGGRIRYNYRSGAHWVICNIYVDGSWRDRIVFHTDCYTEADQPYGAPDDSNLQGDRIGAR